MHSKRSSPGSPLSRPPSSTACLYSISASASAASSASRLNCGLRRDEGKRRTSTSVLIPESCRHAVSSSTGRVPWPIVTTFTRNKMPRSVARKERMAGVITWNRLRELAAFRAQNGLAISLYLGFDPSNAGTIPAAATKINSLLDEAQKSALANREELRHDQKLGLQADFERIHNYFANDFERNGTQGLAIFAAGLDAVWSANALSERVPDRVCVGPDFHLKPLVPL